MSWKESVAAQNNRKLKTVLDLMKCQSCEDDITCTIYCSQFDLILIPEMPVRSKDSQWELELNYSVE